jgi:hypothetical protein
MDNIIGLFDGRELLVLEFPGLIGGWHRKRNDSGRVGETSGVISDLSIETPDVTSHERIPSKYISIYYNQSHSDRVIVIEVTSLLIRRLSIEKHGNSHAKNQNYIYKRSAGRHGNSKTLSLIHTHLPMILHVVVCPTR